MPAYCVVMTETGRVKMAAAAANNSTLDITHMALGDGDGSAVEKPTGYEQALVNEVYRNTLNSLTSNGAQFTADMIIAPNVGGWTVREMGLLDSDGNLVAYANTPAIEKAQLSNGALIDFVPTITVEVESPDSVTVIVNPAIITASRLWVAENYLSKANNLADIQDKAAARVHLGAGTAHGLATLDENGQVPEAQMPIQRLSEVFTAADEAAMLALIAVKGDVCVRIDNNKTYILSTAPATELANWVELQSNTVVISVAGKTGTVELEKTDVGLDAVDNTSDADKPVSTPQGQAIADALSDAVSHTDNAIANLTKDNVGLANVDNTSDVDKPVSTAQSQAIAAVEQYLENHKEDDSAHGATPSNAKNKIIKRDANGRAQVANPVSAQDIATKDYIDKRAATSAALGGIKARLVGDVLYLRTDGSNA